MLMTKQERQEGKLESSRGERGFIYPRAIPGSQCGFFLKWARKF